MIIPAVKQVEQYKPVAKKTSSAASAVSTTKNQGSSGKPVVLNARYTVKSGDSLWSIAKRFNVSVDVLARGNGIRLHDILKLGVVLKVPSGRV